MYLNNGQSQGDSKALACRGAVKFAAKIRLMKITVEGDSEVVINQIQSTNPSLASFGLSHVKRTGNFVFHALARKVRVSDELQVWLEDIYLRRLLLL